MNKINVKKEVLLYFAEQLYMKAYSDGKKGKVDINIEDVVKSLSEQFVYDVERCSLARVINK